MASLLCSIILISTALEVTFGAVYNVGEDKGWNVGRVNYNNWSNSKRFVLRDVLVFQYDRRSHNVLQVSKNDYSKCVTSSPIARYNTGNDSIVLRKAGHSYYICGTRFHCQFGQKVDIDVRSPKEEATLTN